MKTFLRLVLLLLIAASTAQAGLSPALVSAAKRRNTPSGGGAAAFVASVATAGGANTVTSGAIDTTGANFIQVAVSFYNGGGVAGTLTDSRSNTWTAVTTIDSGSPNFVKLAIFRCSSPSVGSGHTFTNTGTAIYTSIAVIAFSGMNTSPADQTNSAASTGVLSVQPGSITAGQANTVLICALAADNNSGTLSINSGFTGVVQVVGSSGTNEGVALAYRIDTSATATNPTWTCSVGTGAMAASISSWKH